MEVFADQDFIMTNEQYNSGIKVELGDRDQAIEVLQAALRLMNAEPDGPERLQDYGQPGKPGSYPIEGGNPEYDSIPF